MRELTIASCASLEHIPQTSERSTRPKCIEAWGILQILWLVKWSDTFSSGKVLIILHVLDD